MFDPRKPLNEQTAVELEDLEGRLTRLIAKYLKRQPPANLLSRLGNVRREVAKRKTEVLEKIIEISG